MATAAISALRQSRTGSVGSVTDPANSSAADDPAVFIHRVRAEIEAEAENRRRRDPEIRRLERDIERAWLEVTPPGAAGDQRDLLLDRADRLSMIDVDAPLGARPGVRQVKGTIRRATYWYLRYVSDQLNAFNNVIARLLRRLDERLAEVESVLHISHETLVDSAPAPSPEAAAVIAETLAPNGGRAVVISCGSGSIVDALSRRGITTYGVDRDTQAILEGTRGGLDLRSGDPLAHVGGLPDHELDAIVLAGVIETLPAPALWQLIEQCRRVLSTDGVVVVASTDPALRDTVHAELLTGRGLSVPTWRHLLLKAGFVVELVPTTDALIPQLVVARSS